MRRAFKLALGTTALLGALFVVHVQLNKGGVARAVRGVGRSSAVRGELEVGFLPVTCHLTCPVTHWITKHSDRGTTFRSKRYTDWATVAEDVKKGTLKASFLLAPMAMALARQGVPVKIVHLGHRDGTTVVVRKDSTYGSFADLRGKIIAVPHLYSNQRILVARELEKFGMTERDVKLVVFPPPEMPSALQRGSVDAYLAGEPMPAKAELEGFGRVLAFTKDIWPGFISCVLVVRDELVRDNRPLVEELVSGIAKSGQWIDAPGTDLLPGVVTSAAAPDDVVLPEGWDATHRSQAAAIAARKEYYGHPPELVKYVLTKPPDRVRYTNLVPARRDLEEIQRLAERLGFFDAATADRPFGFDDYADPSFATAAAP